MPVVITVLNAYSGFALVAEGMRVFFLKEYGQPTILDRSDVTKRLAYCRGQFNWRFWFHSLLHYGEYEPLCLL